MKNSANTKYTTLGIVHIIPGVQEAITQLQQYLDNLKSIVEQGENGRTLVYNTKGEVGLRKKSISGQALWWINATQAQRKKRLKAMLDARKVKAQAQALK